jgi:hypothetical protein
MVLMCLMFVDNNQKKRPIWTSVRMVEAQLKKFLVVGSVS